MGKELELIEDLKRKHARAGELMAALEKSVAIKAWQPAAFDNGPARLLLRHGPLEHKPTPRRLANCGEGARPWIENPQPGARIIANRAACKVVCNGVEHPAESVPDDVWFPLVRDTIAQNGPS